MRRERPTPTRTQPDAARSKPWWTSTARIVRGADFRDQINLTPESPGLRAISDGFPLVARDDQETVERAVFLYDALYASLQARIAGS
jgi:hypothetical protein